MIRQLVAKLQCLIIDRRTAPRHKFCLPITIFIPPEKNLNANLLKQKPLWISGTTKDLSDGGIAFYVSSIRLDEHYLVGEARTLLAKISLPGGEVTMKIVGVRYERENGNFIELKYLIGARISEMETAEREIYRRFLQQNNVREKNVIQEFSSRTLES